EERRPQGGGYRPDAIVGRLTRLLPLGSAFGLPVHLALRPTTPFCESRKHSGLTQAPYKMICCNGYYVLGEFHKYHLFFLSLCIRVIRLFRVTCTHIEAAFT